MLYKTSYCLDKHRMNLKQFILLKSSGTNLIVKRTTVKLSYKTMYNESKDEKKSPILLLHGLFGNKKFYKGMAKILMNITKRVIISADLRNHGKSPHVPTHSYHELATDVQGLLTNKLKVKKSILIGHSTGGRTAMTLALTRPETVAGLIVIDISPVSNSSELKDFRLILKTMAAVDMSVKEDAPLKNTRGELMLRAKKHLADVVKDNFLLDAIVANIVLKKAGQYDWQCNIKVLLDNFDNLLELQLGLGKYLGPTLFIGGQKSHFIPPDDLTRIRDIFPAAVLTYVNDAGHLVHVEQLKHFLELVLTFVRNVD